MKLETGSDWSARYRSVASDEPTPLLDEMIFAAAARRAQRARVARRGAAAVAVAMAAIGIFTLMPHWRMDVHRPYASTRPTGYGLEEGATRYYLAHIAGAPYSGLGSTEDEL